MSKHMIFPINFYLVNPQTLAKSLTLLPLFMIDDKNLMVKPYFGIKHTLHGGPLEIKLESI